jgi:oligopeptide transport system permease protein
MTFLPALLVFAGLPLLLFALARGRLRKGSRRAASRLKRAAWLPLIVLAVHGLAFLVVHAVPGGPFDAERPLAPATRAALEARFGLNEPLLLQWCRAINGVAQLDFGPSLAHRDHAVSDVILEGLPASLLLGVCALFWMLALGLSAGVIAAAHAGGHRDRWINLAVALIQALPSFVLAALLLIPFALWWQVLPVAGLDSLSALILPSLALGLPFAAQVARLVRTAVLDALSQEWPRTWRAAGLNECAILLGAMRLALVPVTAFLGQAAAGILTGSLVIEQIFAIPGLGAHFIESALNRDFTLALGLVTLYTTLAALCNWAADLLLPVFDPRTEGA